MVPGHEIVGIVTGSARTSPNTASAIGSLSAAWSTAARSAASAIRAMNNSASKARLTYSGRDRRDSSLTQGGYSDHVVVREEFVLKLPDSLDISRAAPLLCPHHDLFAAQEISGRAGPEGRRRRARRARSYGRQVRPCARRPCL